ncbi:TonB-dependent receptor [Flavilitoribacter nigricans]|nr:TonB-dependent receptor [Flavilitoribacter nigricans]
MKNQPMHPIYKLLIIGALLMSSVLLPAQNLEDLKITATFEATPTAEVLSTIQATHPVAFYFRSEDLPSAPVSITFQETPLPEVMNRLLAPGGLEYLIYRDYGIVIFPANYLTANYTADFYQALDQQLSGGADPGNQDPDRTIGSLETMRPSGRARISGQILDNQTEEPIIGATLFFTDINAGTATDVDGNFQIEVPSGRHDLSIEYVGYQKIIESVAVLGDGELRVRLEKEAVNLEEVLVKAEALDVNVESTQIGVEQLDVKSINKLPSFLGEVDVVKSLLLQPGVSTIGEGAIGFNVRGGEVDQNLIMQDDGMLFSSSHALGFFSSFNTELISFVTLYKGNLPAQFGGRLASVLNVEMRDGSFRDYRLKGGVGLVSTKVSFEGPVVKEKSSFITGFRSSYSDWVLNFVKLPEIRRSSAKFYDLNFRYTHRLDEKNTLSLAAYSSHDRFTYNELFGFDYNTLMGQAIYKKIFSDDLFSKLSFTASRYESTQLDLDGADASELDNNITYYKIREQLTYTPSRELQWDAGISSILYQVEPGAISPLGNLSQVIPGELEKEQGLESAAFLNGNWTLSPAFSISGGLRFAAYQFLGPKTVFEYADPENPSGENVVTTTRYNNGKVIAAYTSLEPRLSMRYRLGPSASVKAGYSRTSQFINLIANTNTPTPNSLWQLSTDYIRPLRSHNFSVGYFKNFDNNNWETSLETYGRLIDDLFDYKDFADLTMNDQLETELLGGIGRAYGLEMSVRKREGIVNGSLSYTLSRTERQVEGINEGNWFPSNFDKPHDLSMVFNFQPNQRYTLTFNFIYGTGRPTTAPIGSYVEVNDLVVPIYSDRNQLRVPDYHRLDLAFTMGQSHKVNKKVKTSWTISLYNIYGRANAFSVFFTQRPFNTPRANKLSVLGNVFPALTFNFETI